MKRYDPDSKIIDITNYNSKTNYSQNPEYFSSINRINLKKENFKLKNRIDFLYSIINFMLVYNIFLTIAIFYFAILK